jgi:serine protease Do
MNTAIVSRSGGSQGIGFAIPSNMAQRVMGLLRDQGEVTRAWLGVNIQPVTYSIAEVYGLDKPRGVMISNVNEDTPAEEAGLKEGDIILSVDGEEVNTVSRLRNKISLSPVGKETELVILRDGDHKTVSVELGRLDNERIASVSRSEEESREGIEGVTVRNLTPRRRELTGIPDDIKGVVVVDVDRASNASREGLAAGHVILEIGNQRVMDLDDYQSLVEQDKDKPILLRIFRPQNGDRIFLAVPR